MVEEYGQMEDLEDFIVDNMISSTENLHQRVSVQVLAEALAKDIEYSM